MEWTNDMRNELRKLWDDGLSTKDIAIQMNCGLTKNSIIGMADRMDLPKRSTSTKGGQPAYQNKPQTPRKRIRHRTIRPPTLPIKPPPMLIGGPPGGVSLCDLKTGLCRAIIEPEAVSGDVRYCGAETVDNHSFCPGHEAIYYKPKEQRRRDYVPS